jgi:hypothetical protein
MMENLETFDFWSELNKTFFLGGGGVGGRRFISFSEETTDGSGRFPESNSLIM